MPPPQAFNNPSTYVKAAKFQRLANAKEKELAALQSVKEITVQDRVDATVSTIKVRSTTVTSRVNAAAAAATIHAAAICVLTEGISP